MISMEIKMDMNDSISIWIQSLGLLFQACEPLAYDCIRTEEEQTSLIRDIKKHTYYCHDVRNDIEKCVRPKAWDEWNRDDDSVVEERGVAIEPIDRREFGDFLTKIYDGH
jgi:hypothetical protein